MLVAVFLFTVIGVQYFAGIEAFANAVGEKIGAGFAGRIAALVEQKMGENGQCDAYAVGLFAWSFEEEEEESQQFVRM